MSSFNYERMKSEYSESFLIQWIMAVARGSFKGVLWKGGVGDLELQWGEVMKSMEIKDIIWENMNKVGYLFVNYYFWFSSEKKNWNEVFNRIVCLKNIIQNFLVMHFRSLCELCNARRVISIWGYCSIGYKLWIGKSSVGLKWFTDYRF